MALAADREHETAERGARRSSLSDAEDATALRINLTRLRSDPELRSHRIVAKLAAFEHSVRAVAERAEETLRTIDAQQPRSRS
ncbi:hypothetical protein ACFQ10_31245 [Streptomyces indonesiensis]